MIKNISHAGVVIGMIIRNSYNKAGVNFLTPGTLSQQIGFLKHPENHVIKPHVHKSVKREIFYTMEVLLIKSGKVRVDFYSERREYLESYILMHGDLVLLAHGGHGFEILEEAEIIEVKQGPYLGENDKDRFEAVQKEYLKIL